MNKNLSKQIVRARFQQLRNKISNKAERSESLLNQLIKIKQFNSAKTALLYFNTSNEVYTHNIIKYCIDKKVKVLIPYISKSKVGEIKSLQDFKVSGKFKVPHKALSDVELNIDVALIPGFAFDIEGNRIGYGKGWYDKFLSRHPETFKIGICFLEQLYSRELDIESHDIKMDTVISL